ncbi:SMP-30/gluconolactonase/LRE family protein [Stigmatella hybrida]|uniref:SMP-30/gluconolactonase/LRE family protein n=1 Tax=Stigmatella hybrida TaxID=394097 RepID=UPI001CDAA455|nr:SMP-30/gluconolactonase/LRE family protein [Stigmatella hybrida]
MNEPTQAPKPMAQAVSSASVLLWLRPELSRESALEYWRGPHAQQVARTPGLFEYRQHPFAAGGQGLWPGIPEVETTLPETRRIDGMQELTFTGTLGPLRGARQNRRAHRDEANVFQRTLRSLSGPGGGRWYGSGNGDRVGCRCAVLLRRRPGLRRLAFRQFVNHTLGPSLAGLPQVKELRSQVLLPWLKARWPPPGGAHDHPPEERFDALLVLGFASEEALGAFFASPQVSGLAEELRHHCTAIHAYRISHTYTYVVEGRPALPQVKPERKPSLAPLKRVLPAPPPRAARTAGPHPFPEARLFPLSGESPEDVVADGEGRLVCGVRGGRILRLDPVTGKEEVLGNTGGRPLGLELLPDGTVLVCDAHRGLLKLDPRTASIEPLVQFVGDTPLRFCSNVTAARDGTLWFTESTHRFDFEHFVGAMYEHRPSGRLFRRDPDGHVETVLEDLFFANGVTLTEDESALIFAETDGYRLSRYWLKGPKRGQRDILADNLPGFPDNLSRSRDGKFWVALVTPRNPLLDRLGTTPGWIRKALWRVPNALQPGPVKTVWALAFDEQGRLLADLQTQRDDFYGATGVTESKGALYLASIYGHGLLQVRLSH